MPSKATRIAQVERKPTASAPARRPRSLRQAAKNANTRRRLIDAAAKVIGRYGYAGASIARITAQAGVAHGAFYLHFANQQALFDVLLPILGREMLDHIAEAVRDSHTLDELERRGLKANFDYLVEHPALYRIMNEAQLYAPDAFHQHIAATKKAYVQSLKRSRDHGDIAEFSDEEIETVAAVLMGARSYLLMFCHQKNKLRPLTEREISVYLDIFVTALRTPR
jgi:AcrR family transcriptional regulator